MVRARVAASLFQIYADRSDLHASVALYHEQIKWDCTHFCYTPFLYQPMFTLVAHALGVHSGGIYG